MAMKDASQQGPWTSGELADEVNSWCEAHGVSPMGGRASETLNARTIHYYRSLGLVTSPGRGRGQGFGERQFLELVAIRILQAGGLPQKRIQELLYGRRIEDLRRIQQEGIAELSPLEPKAPEATFLSPENWDVTPLSQRHLLMTRSGRAPSTRQIDLIRQILDASPEEVGELESLPTLGKRR